MTARARIDTRKLDSHELSRFRHWLATRPDLEEPLAYYQLHGYLATALSAAERPQDEFVIAAFFPEQPTTDQAMFALLLRFYDTIAAQAADGTLCLPQECRLPADPEAVFCAEQPLHAWCTGAYLGIKLIIHTEPNLPEVPDNLRGLFETFASEFQKLVFFIDRQYAAEIAELRAPGEPFTQYCQRIYQQLAQVLIDLPATFEGYAATNQSLVNVARQLQQASDEEANKELYSDPRYRSAQLIERAEMAETAKQALQLYQEAATLIHRLSGKEFIRANHSHFWSRPTTRLYMKALYGQGLSLFRLGQPKQSAAIFELMLALNPNDDQRVRDPLLEYYLKHRLLDQAQQLLSRFENDDDNFFIFSRALALFAIEGDSPQARAARSQAISCNRFLSQYLSGKRKVPKRMPADFSPGDKHEAQLYAKRGAALWRQYSGAVPWLMAGKQ